MPPSITADEPEAMDLGVLIAAIETSWPIWERATSAASCAWGFLVGVETAGGRLVHRPLDRHPALVLETWTAPWAWCAVGVAVRGLTRRAADTPGTATSARVVWLCHRDGRSASLLGIDGAPPTVVCNTTPTSVTSNHPDGVIPDLLRRCLGRPSLPDAPPDPIH